MQNDPRDELDPRQQDGESQPVDDMRLPDAPPPDQAAMPDEPPMGADEPSGADEAMDAAPAAETEPDRQLEQSWSEAPPMDAPPPRPQEPESQEPEPQDQQAWAVQPVDRDMAESATRAVDEAEEATARDEFETASWPEQDHPHPPPSEVEAYPQPADAAPAADPDVMPAHSVPATEPGESTQCPRCGTENRPGISFCSNCGQRLVVAGAAATVARPAPPEGTQACPRCGTHNRAGVAFCQNCGANLRAAAEGYVPPAVEPAAAAAAQPAEAGGRALLGPVVLVIGGIGLAVGWLLPFMGDVSLYDRSFGRADGYGIAFWNAYSSMPTLSEQAYFGFAAPVPILIGLLALLAIGGFLRPAPAVLQLIGLVVALLWAIGLVVLFVLVEVVGGPGGDLISMLRGLSPGGIILMLASLIVVIGALTRFGRS